MRFIGTIEAKIDAKGRASLPAPFRKELQPSGKQTLYLRKDIFEDCLVLHPETVWNERVDALNRRLSLWNRSHQRILREFMSNVEEITLDANGRFLIPKRYLEMAGIVSDVKFIGKNDIIEIWSCEKSQEPFMDPDDFAQTLEEVMGMEPHVPSLSSTNDIK